MTRSVRRGLLSMSATGIAVLALAIAGCSGGGGGSVAPAPTATPSAGASASPQPTATPTSLPSSFSASITAAVTPQSVALGSVAGGFTGTVSLPAIGAGSVPIALVFGATPPAGIPGISSVKRSTKTIGVPLTGLAYLDFTPSASVTLPTSPAFSLTLAPGDTFAAGSYTSVAFYDPTSTAGWINLDGPGAVVPPATETFAANPVAMTFKANVTYTFAWYSSAAVVPPLAGPSASPSPTPSPTASPSPSPSPSASTTSIPGTGTPLAGPSVGPNNGWSPASVANAFAFPVQSGFDGTGTTIAIVNDSNVSPGDLFQYTTYFQTPATGRTVTVEAVDDASTTPGANGDATEATLDLETVAGLAPGSNILLYVMPALSSQYYNDAFEQIITDGKANVVSISFAGCESSTSPGTSAIIADAVQAGIAFVAAAGDQGSTCFSGSSPGGTAAYAVGVNYPASDPNVVGVGGTETNTSLTSTVAWNDTLSPAGQLASGGGVSTTFALPAFQIGVAGAASSTFRNVPDLAMPAVYTELLLNGQWGLASGTSWASPEFSAMLAEISQYCKVGVANADPLIYGVHASSSAAFLDVVSGNNSVAYGGGSSPAFAAHAGYDNVSGLGVPFGMPFARTLCPNRVASSRFGSRSAAGSDRPPAAVARVVAVPTVRGITDMGERAAATATRIQLVLAAAPTLTSSEQAVLATLRAAGFRIDRTFANHLVIDAEAGTSVVEQLFGTSIHDVAQGRYGTRYMPVRSATLPASLAPYVAGLSLDDVVNMANTNGR